MDYEMIEMIYQNDEWDCDPLHPIHQALIEAVAILAAQKAKEHEWKGPSWNDGHQVKPLLD
jgi:hypothetical protein